MAEEEKKQAGQEQSEAQSGKKDKKNKIKELEHLLEDKDNQIAKDKDDYIRLMAEFENFRRRSAAERLSLISTASEDVILKLLPVLDDCERALKALGESSDSAVAKEGTEMIFNKLFSILSAKGLTKIDVEGKPFDPEIMEAVAQFPAPSEDAKGKVFDIVQNGYKLGDKIIRYAKVVVAQ